MPVEAYRGRWLDDGRNLRLVIGGHVLWVNVWPLDTADVAAAAGTTLLQVSIGNAPKTAAGLTYDRLRGEVVEIRDAAGALRAVDTAALRDGLRALRDAIVARAATWPRDERVAASSVDLRRSSGDPLRYDAVAPAAYTLAATERDDAAIDGVWWAIDAHCPGIACRCRRIVLEIVHAGGSRGGVVYEMAADARELSPEHVWEPWMTADTTFGLVLRDRGAGVPIAVAGAFGRGFLGRMLAGRFFGVQRAARRPGEPAAAP